MTSTKIAEISRSDLADPNTAAAVAAITNVNHLSSYNWIEAREPTIAVPGCPSLWSPPSGPIQVNKDSGMIYIAQNAVRCPEYPLEPLFRSLYIADPSFDFHSVDLVTDRNNIRELLSFVNPKIDKRDVKSFTINVEVIKNTAIFCRTKTRTFRVIKPHENSGYGHEFEKAFTTEQIDGGTGHHRIIQYQFGDLTIVVRYETDGYVGMPAKKTTGKAENDDLSSLLQSLSLSSTPSAASASSKLMIKSEGKMVDIDSTLEIKTRVYSRPIGVQEVLPQLWVSQTPNLVRAYHRQGVFPPPTVKNVTSNIKLWEEDHQNDLRALSTLIKKIISITQEQGGKAVIRYDKQSDRLLISPSEELRLLPADLYSTF